MFVRSCIACDIDDPDALELRVFTVVFSCCAGGGQGRRCRDQWPAAGRPREAAAGATAFRRPATRRLRTAATGTPLAITHTCCLKAALLLQRPSASFTAHVHVHVHGTECSNPGFSFRFLAGLPVLLIAARCLRLNTHSPPSHAGRRRRAGADRQRQWRLPVEAAGGLFVTSAAAAGAAAGAAGRPAAQPPYAAAIAAGAGRTSL